MVISTKPALRARAPDRHLGNVLLAIGAEREAEKRGYTLVVCNTDGSLERERRALAMVLAAGQAASPVWRLVVVGNPGAIIPHPGRGL
jgi:hypothetical protein